MVPLMLSSFADTFYVSFAQRDGEAMAACYGDDAVFEDPVFGELHGGDVGDMWRMLCSRGTDLYVEHRILETTDTTVRTNWTANYTFSATGNTVHNDVEATMTFRDGLIVEHRDRFDFWKWSTQALGLPGRLFGWAPPLRSKVRSTALQNLAAFQAERR